MVLIPIAQPTVEPVALEEAKLHLRIDSTQEDALIASLIAAARVHIEQSLSLAMISQSWTLVLDKWPRSGPVCLPLHPLQSVDAVRVLAGDGSAEIVDPDSYMTDRAGAEPRLMRRSGAIWPGPTREIGGIEIDFVAGFGGQADDVPKPLIQAILVLVAHWYERREQIEVGSSVAILPDRVEQLTRGYRKVRL